MSYREVTMLEIKEVLRLWRAGAAKKRIAAQLGLDIKTVRRYLRVAQGCGPWPAGAGPLDEAQVAAVVAALRPTGAAGAATTGRYAPGSASSLPRT